MTKRSLVLKTAALLGIFIAGVSSAGAADCDRNCLRGFLTQYLSAMGSHNPGALPLASNVRFTEDAKEMKLGDGLF